MIDDTLESDGVHRVIFCTGKIYYDLAAHRETMSNPETIALIRVEELYPFPIKKLQQILQKYNGAEYMWVQEEPENMGAWRYINASFSDYLGIDLTRVCRRPSATPAVASHNMHKTEQNRILIQAVGLPTTKQS